MIPNKLAKHFIKNVFTNNMEDNIHKLSDAYDYFMENLPNNNNNATILHQLLEVIEELELIYFKGLKNVDKRSNNDIAHKCYISDMHENF